MLRLAGVAVCSGDARDLLSGELAVRSAWYAEDLMAGVFDGACFVADDVPGLRSDDAFDRAQCSGVKNEICLGGAWQKMNVGVWPADLVTQKLHSSVAKAVGAVAWKCFVVCRFEGSKDGWDAAAIVVVVESDHGGLLLFDVVALSIVPGARIFNSPSDVSRETSLGIFDTWIHLAAKIHGNRPVFHVKHVRNR